MKLEFATAERVIFGRGELDRLGDLTAGFGARAFVLIGARSAEASGLLGRIERLLEGKMIGFEVARIGAEPSVGMVDRLTRQALSCDAEVIVAIGGGSVMDAGKAVGALMTHAGSAVEFMEGEGGGSRRIEEPSVPVIAVATTAGTGAEVTKNAVIRADDGGFKRSMRSPLMRPRVALVDPELTLTNPREVTAASGADAQAQLIEAFTSRRAGILTDPLAREGLAMAAASLDRVCDHPDDLDAREAMAMASLIGGITLDNAGLGAVHGLASPLGAIGIPHGVICGTLLPEITEANIEIARREAPEGPAIRKYREVARILSEEGSDDLEGLVEKLRAQRERLALACFGSFGFGGGDIPGVLAGCRTGSMAANPVNLPDEALAGILEKFTQSPR